MQLIRLIQQISSPFFDVLFSGVTMLGEQLVIALALAVLYWCYDKSFGRQVAFGVFASLCFNNYLKDIVRAPRPSGEGIVSKRPETATGYSFPSGHTQGAATLYGSIAHRVRRPWAYAVAAAISLLVAFSRMYLGAHFLRDVLCGILFGGLFVAIADILYRRFSDHHLVHLAFCLFFATGCFFAETPDFYKVLGLLVGFTAAVFVEERYIRFSVQGTVWRRILRAAAGLVLVLLVQLAGKAIFPENLFCDFLRYFFLSFCGFALIPFLFTVFRL